MVATLAGRPRAPFVYVDKGSLAVIGRERAVAQIGRLRFGGAFAWALWAFVHLVYLVGFRKQLGVLAEWTYAYLTRDRGHRVISERVSSLDGERDERRVA